MKYIRNEKGVLKIIRLDQYVVSYENGQYAGTMDIEKLKECKVADTIEELCDEFVYHLKSGGKFIDDKLAKSNVYENIYGAIWTDKGLIYVAKMNDKGELELL